MEDPERQQKTSELWPFALTNLGAPEVEQRVARDSGGNFCWHKLSRFVTVVGSGGNWRRLQLGPVQYTSPNLSSLCLERITSDGDLHFLIWYCSLFSAASYYQSVKFVQINIWSPLPIWGALKAWVIYQWPNVIAFSKIWVSKRKSDLDLCSEWFNLCRSNGSEKGGGGKVVIWRLNSS